MSTIDSAKRYMNIMALGLKIVSMFCAPFNQIFSIRNYKQIAEFIKNKMDSYWCTDNERFLEDIENFLRDIEKEETEDKIVMALEFCKWLDFKITYLKNENNSNGDRQFFSLYWLVQFSDNRYAEIDALNTNWRETGIWINPKFEIASPYIICEGISVQKNIANRDAFEGINGILKNCSYIFWSEKNKVKNIIVSNDFLYEKDNDRFTIAFSPMSDRSDLIKIEEQLVERDGTTFEGEGVVEISNAEILHERLKNDWILASDINADIFFSPELLGTELSEENDGFYNETIRNLSNLRLGNGESVPKLTILPSYWSNQRNTATIVGQDGEIIACQEKHIPFVDIKNNKIEALSELSEWFTVLIHIPNVHRIAVVICAEFLSDQKRVEEVICGSLGATLVIVPSYSRGEQDFINALSTLKRYGTTVVWGNCCGAVSRSQKAIGGCGIAGTTKTFIFGGECQCEFLCNDIKACVFKIDIPLHFELKKIEESRHIAFVTHEIRR